MLLTKALKEWAIAVDALTAGKTIALLRKGGIGEKKFQVKSDRIWLYPTYEHQKPHLLKPEYSQNVVPVASGWHPQTVEIKSYADITDVISISDRQQIEALLPYHVWNDRMIGDRLKWKPQQPLMVLLLRVYCLPSSQSIPFNSAYGGCKSWIDLLEPIDTKSASKAIEDSQYERLVAEIKNITSP